MKTNVYLLLLFAACILLQACEKKETEIQYPEEGIYGKNLLRLDSVDYWDGFCSLSAILEKDAQLRVKIKGSAGIQFIPTYTSWDIYEFENQEFSWEFISNRSGTLDGKMNLVRNRTLEVLVYENGASEPSWTKIFRVK